MDIAAIAAAAPELSPIHFRPQAHDNNIITITIIRARASLQISVGHPLRQLRTLYNIVPTETAAAFRYNILLLYIIVDLVSWKKVYKAPIIMHMMAARGKI